MAAPHLPLDNDEVRSIQIMAHVGAVPHGVDGHFRSDNDGRRGEVKEVSIPSLHIQKFMPVLRFIDFLMLRQQLQQRFKYYDPVLHINPICVPPLKLRYIPKSLNRKNPNVIEHTVHFVKFGVNSTVSGTTVVVIFWQSLVKCVIYN